MTYWIHKNEAIILIIFISFVAFYLFHYCVRWYLFGKFTFPTFSYFKFVRKLRKRPQHIPDSQSLQFVPPNKKWRISNEVVSLFHSVISGAWALYACAIYNDIFLNITSFKNDELRLLIFISFGYILHDLIDLLINERSYRILELLFHHIIVICAFLTTLITSRFLGLVILGLLMELNSIFLHTRSLMNLYGKSKKSVAFKFVALLNIFTFLIFRIAVSIYLIYWQLTHAMKLEWFLALATFIIIFSLFITNSILFYRVLAADGLLGKKNARNSTNINKSNALTLQTKDKIMKVNIDEEDEDFSDFDDTKNNKIEKKCVNLSPKNQTQINSLPNESHVTVETQN